MENNKIFELNDSKTDYKMSKKQIENSKSQRHENENESIKNRMDDTNLNMKETSPTIKKSLHKSKILSKRDKNFGNLSARSQSQPREAEKLTSPEADRLICYVKRSLSSPKYDEYKDSVEEQKDIHSSIENLSRIQKNLQRFEEETKRLSAGKHDIKVRLRHAYDKDNRKKIYQHCLRINNENVLKNNDYTSRRKVRDYNGNEESSTQLSSSDIDNLREDGVSKALINNCSKPINADRKPISRRGSLSPVRPQRRTKLQKSNTLLITDRSKENKNITDNIQNPIEVVNGISNEDTEYNANSYSKEKKVDLPERTIFTQKSDQISLKSILKHFYVEAKHEWKLMKIKYVTKISEIIVLRNKCISHFILLCILCGFGGLLFRYTEGNSENIYKCEVRKVKRDFIDNLWTVSHNMREDDWKSLARQKLRKFEEELIVLQELGIRRNPHLKSWNFINCILYCWTVVTTIGYGHITPQTSLGRSLTIVYAIIGIPMFLILLADFGKLFTRGMKFLWAYVRRLYYTGTCRQIRKQQQVRDAMTGFTTVYNIAIRRPSHFFQTNVVENDTESQLSAGKSKSIARTDTPTSPYPETYEIDDEFNLPVSVASVLLISYILIGAFVYTLWEEWTYFEAFYFVFISMSTIGFGDFVPNHPIFMMCSILYLIFGLALTSMFINVVQIKLSDTFKHASAKIGATIGFGLASEVGEEAPRI